MGFLLTPPSGNAQLRVQIYGSKDAHPYPDTFYQAMNDSDPGEGILRADSGGKQVWTCAARALGKLLPDSL